MDKIEKLALYDVVFKLRSALKRHVRTVTCGTEYCPMCQVLEETKLWDNLK